MTTQTEWAHLPNAKYIDMILANLKLHATIWAGAPYDVSRNVAWHTARGVAGPEAISAWNTAWPVVSVSVQDEVYGEACGEAYDDACDAAMGAILALIAYDDCAYMFDCDLDEIKILAKLGDPRAILLLPACIAFNRSKELENGYHVQQ